MQILQSLQAISSTDTEVPLWHAKGLPTPPSWQLTSAALEDRNALLAELDELSAKQPAGHYWVLHQGRMNATSLRQSLVNLHGSNALLEALAAHFAQGNAQAIVQLLPGWQAAGILFTRHPLRQDLDHLVLEVVAAESAPAQRLIFHEDGRLAFAPDACQTEVLPTAQLLALATQLKTGFDKPQAAEWVYDGAQVWLLQTLPIGSLPEPTEAWSCRVEDGFWPQAVTPLWYTLESRWLKNRFWEPLVAKAGWQALHKVEPYRRQHSHIYRNSQFFRQLSGFAQALPPAWREAQARTPVSSLAAPGWWTRWRLARQLAQVKTRLARCLTQANGHWHRLLELDLLGEELAAVIGHLHYCRPQLPATLPAGVIHWLSGKNESLRAGTDPIHAPMREQPPEASSLPAPDARLAGLLQAKTDGAWGALKMDADRVREQLADALHDVLLHLGNELAAKGQLPQAEDVHFCYFDELWRLCEHKPLPPNLTAEGLAKRKLRYLEDAHTGAPDWKLDQLGFGFNQDHQAHELLLGKTAAPGQAQGRVRRLVSSWVLNQVQPGELLVMHQCDPHWLPWLSQAGGLILATRNAQDPAIALARSLGIPCIYSLDDAMHCLADGQQVQMDADSGRVVLLGS